LGQRAKPFAFTGLDDQPVGADQLAGKLAVLVWFQDHPASRAALEQLGTVHAKYRDEDRVVFRAICTEPSTARSHRQVGSLVRSWNVDLPVVRDLDACGRDVFHVQKAPTLVILAPDGVVQLVQEGADSELGQQLAVVLERLLAGEDIARDYLRFAEQQRRDYQRQLAAASVQTPETEIKLPEVQIAPRSQPRLLRLDPQWSCRDLTAPGNLLVTPGPDDRPSIFAMDGWRHVVHIRPDGSVAARHPLPIDEEGAVSFLRSQVDGRGERYFVGTARLARQLHVFDPRWQRVLSYPDAKQRHDGIQDVQLADLDANGQLELYVAFAGLVGLQRVDLHGKRQWSNRAVPSILSLAVEPAKKQPARLLATSYLGQVVPVRASGEHAQPVAVTGRAVHQLVASHHGSDRPSRLCGVSYTPDGGRLAIGINANLEEVWSYDLPAGVFSSQIQSIAPARLLDGPGFQWVLAGADGSIHVVADDGRFHDSFNYGEEVTGLAGVELERQKLLVIAARQSVSAWKLTPPPTSGQP
jgi:hypothetical protein